MTGMARCVKTKIPNQSDLESADYLLRLRGSSLMKLVWQLKDGNDTAPIIIPGMKPNAETLQAFKEADDPSCCTVFNSVDEMFKVLCGE